jgi:hypothetical protein
MAAVPRRVGSRTLAVVGTVATEWRLAREEDRSPSGPVAIKPCCLFPLYQTEKHDLWKGTGMVFGPGEDLARNLPVHRVNSIEHLSSLRNWPYIWTLFGKG